jgi:hypothetical protein
MYIVVGNGFDHAAALSGTEELHPNKTFKTTTSLLISMAIRNRNFGKSRVGRDNIISAPFSTDH